MYVAAPPLKQAKRVARKLLGEVGSIPLVRPFIIYHMLGFAYHAEVPAVSFDFWPSFFDYRRLFLHSHPSIEVLFAQEIALTIQKQWREAMNYQMKRNMLTPVS